MAIDYDLEVKTKKTPLELFQLILQVKGFQSNQDENEFYAEGLTGGVRKQFELNQELINSDFGFIPTLNIWFRPLRNEFEEAGMQNMMKAVMAILHQCNDAVMLMNGEYIVLTRIGGSLILNEQSFGGNDKRWWNTKNIPFALFEVKELDLVG